MTRLTTDDIETVGSKLATYDRCIKDVTGQPLLGIAAHAAGMADLATLRSLAPGITIAVVPIRSGLGIIGGFADTVCAILNHIGFGATVTRQTDVAGFAEAFEIGARVIMAADDDRFVAFCPGQGQLVDNTPATARGFVAGLDLMARGLAGREVLVLGCGPVGEDAAMALIERGAKVAVCDRVVQRAMDLARRMRENHKAEVAVIPEVERALIEHQRIFDATTAADLIQARHVDAHTLVAAPGMPCGIAPDAFAKLAGRVLHDPLQIGVATMACEAVHILSSNDTPGAHRP